MIADVPTVEFEVAKLDNNGEANGEREAVSVRLDNRALLKLEERFGSLQKFAETMQAKPLSATIDLLSALCGWRTAEARERLLPGTAMHIVQDVFRAYVAAIGGEDEVPLGEVTAERSTAAA